MTRNFRVEIIEMIPVDSTHASRVEYHPSTVKMKLSVNFFTFFLKYWKREENNYSSMQWHSLEQLCFKIESSVKFK
jgi:hypothetical protein